MRVMREVRFSLGPDTNTEVTNSYAGWPSAAGIAPYLVLQGVIAGEPDPRTGYLANITRIDRLFREHSIPLIRRMYEAGEGDAGRILIAVAEDLQPHAPERTAWVSLHLKVTPFLVFSFDWETPNMILLTQSFEFAAAHRLHCPDMTDEENRAYFGKCNNPNGHGHNYVLDVTIARPLDEASARPMPLPDFERIVRQRVIDRFDHKHLNLDCPEFRELNPSVENIARVIWRLLDGHLGSAKLARIRVWETSKTYAEYEERR